MTNKKAKIQLRSKIRQIIMTHPNNNKEDCINQLCSMVNYYNDKKVTPKQANTLIEKAWPDRKWNRCREFC